MPPARLRWCTWDELDALQCGNDTRMQKQMVGFRMLGTQIYNMLSDKPLKEHQFMMLPAVDLPIVGSESIDRGAWKQRMKDKYGDKLEA